MTKVNFILELNERLDGLPRFEVEEHISFYVEMIEDRIEDGMTEEEAVAAAGSIDDIAEQIIADIPLYKIAKEKIKPKRKLKAVEIVLIAVGSPVWVPLLIAAVAVVFSLYISLWAVVVSLWAVFGSFVGCFVGGIAASVILLVGKNLSGIAMMAKYYPIKPIGVKKATEHMLSEVKNGKLACFISVPSESFPENPFSKGHHYVLIVGFMEDGKILIANSSVKHQPEIEGINIVDAETIEKALSPVADPLPNRTWGVMENLDEACGYIIAE